MTTRPDPDAVRQVTALVTARLHTPNEECRQSRMVLDAYGDVLFNASACIPILHHLVQTLLREVAELRGIPATELWQQRALTTAAINEEGNPRG